MIIMKRAALLLITVLFIQLVSAQSEFNGFNCSTIIIGKEASVTGNVLIGHNEDDGGRQVVNYYKIAAIDQEEEYISLKNGAEIEQVDRTFGFIWLEMPDQEFADCFLNDNGVIIVSNSCPSQEREGEITDGGIGYDLRKLIAERAESARHGVRLAGKLICDLGYYASGRTYTIADKDEAWMLSVVNGKHWVAQRVADDHVVYLPNYYIIKEVDLEDKDMFLASPGLIDYAIQKGWYNKDEGDFNFREAYGNRRSAASMSNIGRMRTGVEALSGKKYDLEADFPTTFKPEKAVSMDDIMTILTNHYEGTELDDSDIYTKHNPHSNKTMNICAGHQQMSMFAELRDNLPVEIACRLWTAPRRGCVHPYIPIYYGTQNFPGSMNLYPADEVYSKHFDPDESIYDRGNGKAWWSFVDVTEYVDDDYLNRIEERREIKDKMQSYYYERVMEFDKEIIRLWKKDNTKALEEITKFSNEMINYALQSNKKYLNRE